MTFAGSLNATVPPRLLSHNVVPHAVFADPQVAGAAFTEQEARRHGVEYVVALRPYADVAYGWALEDTTSFVNLLADPKQRTLLSVHIIGLRPPAAASAGGLLGQTVDQLAHDVLYVHPALPEVLEEALLELASNDSCIEPKQQGRGTGLGEEFNLPPAR